MNGISNNMLNSAYFGKKDTPNQVSAPLNIGVVTPPNALPNASLYTSVRSMDTMPYKKVTGGQKFDAGKTSAILAFSSMALALAAFLPFIRKR